MDPTRSLPTALQWESIVFLRARLQRVNSAHLEAQLWGANRAFLGACLWRVIMIINVWCVVLPCHSKSAMTTVFHALLVRDSLHSGMDCLRQPILDRPLLWG